MNTVTRISRDLAAQYGRQAVEIINTGRYSTTTGRQIDLTALIARCVAETRTYPSDQAFPESKPGPYRTAITVVNDTTLAAANKLQAEGFNTVALSFASATHPGGGFLNGARAQEEYLARSSALYACIRDNPMYTFHRSRHDPLYTNYAIYSPQVPVFRADDGKLLETPYTIGIITSPAVNVNALDVRRQAEVGPAMWARILKVLSIGLEHGHDAIVLGAWGCGAFGNDTRQVAELFRRALTGNFLGVYKKVVFAILDWSREQKSIGPFLAAFPE